MKKEDLVGRTLELVTKSCLIVLKFQAGIITLSCIQFRHPHLYFLLSTLKTNNSQKQKRT